MGPINVVAEDRLAAAASPETLTVKEAALLLRVNHKTLRDAINRREVPGVVRLGTTIRIGRAALIQWLGGSPVLRSE